MPRSSWDNPLATYFKATTFGHQFGARLILAATKLMTGLVCKVQDPAACWQLLQFILVLLALEDFGNLPFANSSSSSRCGTWNPRAVGQARPTWSCRFWQTNILGSLSNIIPECLQCNFGAPSQIVNHQVMGWGVSIVLLYLHCAHMGPHLGDPVPMGTFFSFWVPIGSPFLF